MVTTHGERAIASIGRLLQSQAVQKIRLGIREKLDLIDRLTGESTRVQGPALVLVIDERLLVQGW